MKGATRWDVLGLSTLFFNSEHFNFIVSSFFSYSLEIYIYFLESPFSNYNFIFQISIDKNFTTPNFNFVNEPDLTRILRFEIFLHMDGQLCAAYIILEYKPISSNFQSQLQQINITIPRFLTSPPPEGTHQVEWPT